MRICWTVILMCFVVFSSGNSSEVAPQIIYGTYLGRHKECATAIAVDGFGNAYVAGRTPSPDFQGEDAPLSVSARMPGSLFVSARSGSTDFPVTRNAIYKRLEVRNDSILARLRAYDGEIQYATFVGGTRHPDASWYDDEATGVFANNNGDVYVTGCTVDDRLPVTAGALQAQRKGNALHIRAAYEIHCLAANHSGR
jgi:hypothetical protein